MARTSSAKKINPDGNRGETAIVEVSPIQGAKEMTENSPVQMQQVIAQLISGRSVKQIAENLEIPAGRITRWYRSSSKFAELLADTEAEVIGALRAEVRAEAARSLDDLLPQATEVMGAMLKSSRDSVRLAAAAHIMRFSGVNTVGTRKGPVIEELLKGRSHVRPSAGD